MKCSTRPWLAAGAALLATGLSIGTLAPAASAVDAVPAPVPSTQPTTDEPSAPDASATPEAPPTPDASATPDAPARPADRAATPSNDTDIAVLLQGVRTGSAPFDADDAPGHDSGPTNDVIRSHDDVVYALEVQLTGAALDDRITIHQTLADGLAWPDVSGLPGYCGEGSTVSTDRLVLDCVVTGVQANSVSTYELIASAQAHLPGGSVLTAPADAIEVHATDAALQTPVSGSADVPEVRLSSSPRVNLGVRRASANAGQTDGGDIGFLISYDLFLDIADFNSAGGLGARGQSSVVGDVTFAVDLAQLSPNARPSAVTPFCAAGARENRVFPKASGGGADAVTDSGTWTCALDPSDPTRILVSISGADLSGDHVPTQSGSGASLTAGYLSLGNIQLFVPRDDVPARGSLNTTLTLSDLAASGVDAAGDPVPNAPESLSDNTSVTRLVRRESGDHGTRYTDKQAYLPVPGQSVLGSGDGVVVAGQSYSTWTTFVNSGEATYSGLIMCQAFDTKTQQATGTRPASSRVTGGKADIVIEYGTRPTVDVAADEATRWQQMEDTTCEDGDDAWTSDAGSLDPRNITKVRYRVADDAVPPGLAISGILNLELRGPQPVGTIVAQSYSLKNPQQYPTDEQTEKYVVRNGWYHGRYRPAEATNADFPAGDRLIAAGARTALSKTAISPAVLPGSPAQIVSGGRVQFEIRPTVASTNQEADTAEDTVVTDRLPAGLRFDPAGASVLPTSVTPQADGSTLLTWELGTMARGSEPTITYWADSDALLSGDLVNQAVVHSSSDPSSLREAPADPSVRDPHYGRQTVVLSSPGGLRIDKQVSQRAVEPGGRIDYEVSFANMNASGPQQNVSVVDVLPYDGDVRGSTRNAILSDTIQPPTGAVVTYTSAEAQAVFENAAADGSPDFGALPAGSDWCADVDFGTTACPASLSEVTAIRIDVASMNPLERLDIRYSTAALGAATGDRFQNDASIRSDSQALGARSPLVSTLVVSSTIGQRLWWDQNGNGLDDDGEDGAPGPGVADATLRLVGVDTFGADVDRTTTTDDDGAYRFEDLISGSYKLVVDVPDGAGISPLREGDDDVRNSALDRETGVMEGIEIADPSPTGANGVDLRWNGGFIVGAQPPVEPAFPDAAPDAVRPSAPQFAVTGPAGLAMLVMAAAGLLAVGGTLAVLARRRRHGHRQTIPASPVGSSE